MSRVRSFTIAGVVAGVFALAAACSGGSGGGSASNNDADGLKSATKDFGAIVLSDSPGDAYKYLTADCTKKVSKDKFTSEVKQGIALLKGFAGKDANDLKVGKVETRNVKDGKGESKAVVVGSNGKALPGGSTWDKWVYQDGSWHFVSCDFSSGATVSTDSGSSDSSSFSDFSDFSSLDSQLSDFSDSFGSLFSNS